MSMNGLERIRQKRKEIEALCVRTRVKRLFVFGSAVDPTEESPRDLDFLVEFEKLTPREYAESYYALEETLQQMFSMPIDLIDARKLTNPYLVPRVEKEKVPLYEAA